MIISNVTFMGYFPQCLKSSVLQNVQPIGIGPKTLFRYRDKEIEYLFSIGKNFNEIFSNISSDVYYDSTYVLNFFNEQLTIFNTREQNADVKMFDVILSNCFKRVCFYSYDHPYEFILDILANRILEKLNCKKDNEIFLGKIDYSMSQQCQPIYPSVLKALNLYRFLDLNDSFYINKLVLPKKFNFKEYVQIYINSLTLGYKIPLVSKKEK